MAEELGDNLILADSPEVDDHILKWVTINAGGNVLRFDADPVDIMDAIEAFSEGRSFICLTNEGSRMVVPHHAVGFIVINTAAQIRAEQERAEENRRRNALAPGGVRQR